MWQEFKAFILRGSVIDLAVGIIVGAAFTGIVNSLVGDLLMPVIGILAGSMDFSNYFFALNGEDYASLKAAKDAGAPVLAYGAFINTVINFLIVSSAIFILVKQVNRFRRTQEAAASTPPPSELLLAEIRDLLKRQ
jgi:large conductance mechanosensitive channel